MREWRYALRLLVALPACLLVAIGACTKDADPERPPVAATPNAARPVSPVDPPVAEQPAANQPSAALSRSVNAAPNAPVRGESDGIPRAVADPLLAIAAEYRSYGRVDDEMRWAPFLCRIPMPASAHLSKSRHESTHGRKLYSLFAKNRAGYLSIATKPPEAGQVIVKESWLPEEVDADKVPPRMFTEPIPGAPADEPPDKPDDKPPDDSSPTALIGTGDHFHPYARAGDKAYRARERGPLFIMYKLADDATDTDRGWVYGTVSTDGQTATSGGLVRSCMKCHEKAPHSRLFGLGYKGP